MTDALKTISDSATSVWRTTTEQVQAHPLLDAALVVTAGIAFRGKLGKIWPCAKELLAEGESAAKKPAESVISAEIIQPAKSIVTSASSGKVEDLIAEVTNYSFVGKMERGTHGAYLVSDGDNVQHIFKLVSHDDVTAQIRRSAQAASAVNSLASRTPTYEEVRFTPGRGSWYVQELLSGKPAPYPSDKLIGQMVSLNDRQAGRAISGADDWNSKVLSTLRDDTHGWKRHIARSGNEGADLVGKVDSFLSKSGLYVPKAADIVHGDFQHYNALVSSSDRLTGYVDWEGAGLGDRAIDLSRLLFDSYVSEAEIGYRSNPETLNMLANKVRAISGTEGLRQYMGYWILQVADYGTRVGPETLGKFLGVGRRIITDLDAQPITAPGQRSAS